MIIDASTTVSNSQAITVTAYSTNALPLGTDAPSNVISPTTNNLFADAGAGETAFMEFRITEAFNADVGDLATISLQMGACASITSTLGDASTTILVATEQLNILKLLTVGASWCLPIARLPNWWTDSVYGPGAGFLGAAYGVSGGTFTGGKITARLVASPQGLQRRFPDAV